MPAKTQNRTVLTLAAVGILALASGQVQAETVTVPSGEFLMYKPGTNYTVTATFPSGNIWANRVGDNCPVNGGNANYSDGTSGASVDVPGWSSLLAIQSSSSTRCCGTSINDNESTLQGIR